MSNRFFEPLKRIPQRIQNIGFLQKFQDKVFRPDEAIQAINSSSYGMVEQPSCFDFDPYLSLLAIGSKDGSIFIHGGKGVAFTIESGDDHIINCIKFIPNEGRIIVTTQENLMQIFSLDSKTGKWLKTYSCLATPKQNEYITQICYHNGIIYAGFDTGYVYQFPTKDGKICIGTEEQYTISYEKALKEMSFDAKEELNLDSIIISLEVDKSGSHLLIGNQGGCIAVAKIRDEVSEKEDTKKKEGDEVEKKAPSQSANPVKIERSDSSLLRKSKTMTMNIKNSIYGENKINELIFEPFKIAIVPIPVVTHFFLFSTEVKLTSAQWFYTKEEPNQKIVASFDDGSFRVWTYKELEGDAEVEEIKTPDNQNFPYGPMPCNAMEKILHSTTNNGEDLRIFSGGLVKTIKNEPAITILKNTNQFGYGFASKIIDFMLVPEKVMKPIEENDKKTASMANEYPAYLFVLTEKEFYIIDLISENCKVLENPYLSCLDFSPITTAAYVEDVDEKIILGLVESNGLFNADETKPITSWPIVGGLSDENERGFTKNNILFLGHEESCISLWQLENGSCMRSLGVFFVSDLFNTTQEIVNDSWPFFKKIGMSQLYDRVEPINQEIESNCHSITTLEILKCEKTLKVVVGAGNGHVSVWEINHSKKSIFEPDVNLCVVDLIERNENIVDNTSAPLPAKEGVFNSSTIASKMIHPVKMVQMKPVSPINKIVISDDWNNFAVATNYGFAVINYTTNQIMSSYFTPKIEDFKTQEMNGHSNGVPITKQQSTISMKGKNLKSIRTSFKKMKITNNNHKASKETKIEEVIEENIVPKNVENGTNGHSEKEKETPENVETKTTNGHDESQETVCEEKISKEKIEEDTRLNLIPAHISWTITSIIFTNGPLKPQEKSSPILIAGTGSGSLLIFDIKKLIMDGSDKEEAMVLCKELHLQHGAPVVNIFMLDQKTHSPITLKTVEDMKKEIEEEKLTALEPEEKKEKSKVEKKSEEEPIKEEKGGKKAKDNEDKSKTKEEEKKTVEVKKVEKQAPIDFSQDLVVVSEEQIKIFNFPSLVPKQKYKFIDRSGKMMTLNLKQAALKGVTPSKNNQSVDESKQHEQDIENMCLRKRIFSASIKQVKISENAKFSYIAVNLADGHVVVHSLPNLRRQAKIQSQNNSQSGLISASSVNGINSYTCFSAIASSKKSNSNIIATEIVRGNHQLRAIQAAVIKLPEWSRPNLATVISDAIGESVSKTLDEVNEKIMKPVEETSLQTKEKIFSHVEAEVKDISDFVEGKIETGKKLLNDVCNEMNDSIIKNGNHSIGDITMDTVKEYFQSDGVVSVKTSEVTMEKRTTIKDGDISTTVRETEKVDGEIIKDDITKLKSTSQIVDNQQEIPTN